MRILILLALLSLVGCGSYEPVPVLRPNQLMQTQPNYAEGRVLAVNNAFGGDQQVTLDVGGSRESARNHTSNGNFIPLAPGDLVVVIYNKAKTRSDTVTIVGFLKQEKE